ncbi:ATP-binding cassette domain-containing protein, partial [Acinetobacter guillouiae]|uniref:ATP-binding cassette domain-containing protein n=2 Tax=Acinetobacter TaxID=469 RepID=UPI00300AA756
GLETRIGDKGVTLSGGQKQRIALARSILKNSPILALDDSTSALDSTTEKQVLQRLSGLADNKNQLKRTILINSNKQTTISLSDRIIVLDQGQILAQGSHTELLQHCEFYRELMGFQKAQQEIQA